MSLQAYHSSLNEVPDIRQVGNLSVLPIKSKFRGPSPIGECAHRRCLSGWSYSRYANYHFVL